MDLGVIGFGWRGGKVGLRLLHDGRGRTFADKRLSAMRFGDGGRLDSRPGP